VSAEIAEVSIPDNVPGEVRSWLSEAANALVGAYADDLDALILFGSAAEGRMREIYGGFGRSARQGAASMPCVNSRVRFR